MFCRKCGKEVDPNDMFCWNCGTAIPKPGNAPQAAQPQQYTTQPTPQPQQYTTQQAAQPTPQPQQYTTQQAAQPTPQPQQYTAQQAAQPTPQPQQYTAQQAAQPTPQPQQYTAQPQQFTAQQEPQMTGPAPTPQMYGPQDAAQTPVQGMESAAYSNKVVNVSKETEEYDYRKLPTEKPTGIRSIYFVDFLLRLTGKSNIALCIYLVLNVLLISVFVMAFFGLPVGWGIVAALLLYIASISIAISPIGEFVLRRQNGCRKIDEVAVINRLEPLFREVYYKAKKGNPMIPSDVRLFINDDECPNAFATGRKTICVTRGLLELSDEEIKATLGHEFGHLAHKDTDRILVVAIGNTVIEGICIMFQIAAIVMEVIMGITAIFMKDEDGIIMHMFGALARFLTIVIIRAFNRVWTQIGILLCMKSSRDNEYLADEFSFNLGYGNGLCQLLSSLPSEKPKGLFANLSSSHPQNTDRIARLQSLGATYGITE